MIAQTDYIQDVLDTPQSASKKGFWYYTLRKTRTFVDGGGVPLTILSTKNSNFSQKILAKMV